MTNTTTNERTDWLDLSNYWAATAIKSGIKLLAGEGGYTQIRVEGTKADYLRLVDAIRASGGRKGSITVAVKRIEGFLSSW